jgi:hypothetical protein
VTRTRWSDRDGLSAWWGRWGSTLVNVFAVGMAAYAVLGVRSHVDDLEREGRARVDSTCTIFERKQATDVDALARTYEYLAGLSGKQFTEPLNRAVLAQLPRTIREAQTDDAPLYCDKAGVGLPEPDPPGPCPKRGERPKDCLAPPPGLPSG